MQVKTQIEIEDAVGEQVVEEGRCAAEVTRSIGMVLIPRSISPSVSAGMVASASGESGVSWRCFIGAASITRCSSSADMPL